MSPDEQVELEWRGRTALVARVRSYLRLLPPPLIERLKWSAGTRPRRSRHRERDDVERFLAAEADAIRGRVLVTQGAVPALRYGRGITSVEVLDYDPLNPEATLLADITEVGSLFREAFDCVVVVDVPPDSSPVGLTLDSAWRSVAPGGALLLVLASVGVSDVSGHAADASQVADRLRHLVTRHCADGEPQCREVGQAAVARVTKVSSL